MTNTPLADFDAAIAKVTQDRGSIYGHPNDDFGKVVTMSSGIASCPDEKLAHVLYMILVKVARLSNTPSHLDSWIDIAGYARTAAMILDSRAENGQPQSQS